jgi:hypothetical protein
MTKGQRNNNPGNIKYGPGVAKLKGLAEPPSDGTMCRFTSMAMGVRAIAVVLETYYDRHGLITVRQLIRRWAPPGVDANPESTYIAFVAKRLGVEPDDQINLHDRATMEGLVRSIITFENGGPVATDQQIAQGINLAGFKPDVKVAAQSKTVAASTVAAGSTGLGAVADQMRDASDQLSGFATISKYVALACVALTLGSVGFIVWQRLQMSRNGLV